MDIYRPERLSEIVGHTNLVQNLADKARNGKLSHFIILCGDEGLGKTTLAGHLALALNCKSTVAPCYTCAICKEGLEKVIRKGQSTINTQIFTVTRDGGVDEAKNIKDNLNASFITGENKVLILEDLHSMKEDGQELLLTPLERLPKNVYVIATANSMSPILMKLQSRAVTYHMHKLTKSEMLLLLKREAARRGLRFPSDAVFSMIASWADNKPRKALKALEAMGEDTVVTLEEIKEFISYLDIKKVVPIIAAFGGSPLVGMSACKEMPTDETTQRYLIDILIAAINIAYKQPVSDIDPQDRAKVSEAVGKLDPKVLESFLLEVCRMPRLDNRRLLAAFLACHPSREAIFTPSSAVLDKERADRFEARRRTTVKEEAVNKKLAPDIASLLKDGVIFSDEE